MEGRSTVGLFLVVVAAAASSLIMLLERRPSPPATTSSSSNVLKNNKPFTVIQLKGSGHETASLAVMLHDVSLAGFANRSGHWHAFPGHEHLLPGATPLPFGNSYRDLIGGLANLPNLPLGGPPMVQASSAISGYSPAIADDDEVASVKRGLATLTVMTCEAQRLQLIRDLLLNKGRWESGEARVAVEHLPYIEHWDTICYEIVRAKKNGVWDGPFTQLLKEHANIKNKEEAMAVVGFVTTSRTLQDLVLAHARRA
ncbi:hypothetical protein HU200_065298 [Digitaria exilis]|uniref:rRNA N-glycosylase n=1 Tax=Digitaria exilis TaxID=1010633 RepID=A0A834ZYH6_9POAL|nr:hypothetical protein HU200_065298 [Digitaria exilis]